MSKYKVFIHGRNFLLNLEGDSQKHGFYTTRFVEAKSEEEAEEKAISILRDDPKLRGSASNDWSDPPIMFVEEMTELDPSEDINVPVMGYSFYLE
jgi:hypothetical protein